MGGGEGVGAGGGGGGGEQNYDHIMKVHHISLFTCITHDKEK